MREFRRANEAHNTLPCIKPLTRALLEAGDNEDILEDLLIANIRYGQGSCLACYCSSRSSCHPDPIQKGSPASV